MYLGSGMKFSRASWRPATKMVKPSWVLVWAQKHTGQRLSLGLLVWATNRTPQPTIGVWRSRSTFAALATKSALPSSQHAVFPSSQSAAPARRSALCGSQIVLRLPRNQHVDIRKVLHRPQNLHFLVHKLIQVEVHKVLPLPRNQHFHIHKMLRLLRDLHYCWPGKTPCNHASKVPVLIWSGQRGCRCLCYVQSVA